MVRHHLAMFGVHRSSASGDITFLLYSITSQEHVIEGWCDFMDWSYLLYVTTLQSLLAIGSYGSGNVISLIFHICHQTPRLKNHVRCGDIMVLVCHVILQYHLTKWSFDFMGRSPSRYFFILKTLGS